MAQMKRRSSSIFKRSMTNMASVEETELSTTLAGQGGARRRKSIAANFPTDADLEQNNTENNTGNNDSNLAELALEHLEDGSLFCLEHEPRAIPYFEQKELNLGRFLGEGEFGTVYEVFGLGNDTGNGAQESNHGPLPEAPASNGQVEPNQGGQSNSMESFGDFDEQNDDEEELKRFMMMHPNRGGKPRYAAKHIKKRLEGHMREDAIIDLACEAAFLSRILHPNIVRLRGTVGTPGSPKFTLILDRLDQTLTNKIADWKDEFKRRTKNFFRKDKLGLASLFHERLLAAYDIARALRHLHSLNLLFRDLKPDNCGFDFRGDARLFDFGLCKELKEQDLVQKDPDAYRASGLTGSRRYMSPEVAKCLPYGCAADVYSFGILFWQIFALKTPFDEFTASKHTARVVLGGKRPPSIQNMLGPRSKTLHKLMESCWAEDPSKRPSFEGVCSAICAELEMLDNGAGPLDRSNMLLAESRHSRHFLLGQ